MLSWTVDELAEGPQITFTDPRGTDWLWRVLGEAGHLLVAAALEEPAAVPPAVELAGVAVIPGTTEPRCAASGVGSLAAPVVARK